MDNQKFKLTITSLFSSLFGFGNALLLSYIHYRAYLTPNKCIKVCINLYGEMYLDFIMCILSLIATLWGTVYSLYVLFKGDRKKVKLRGGANEGE